VVFFYQHNPRLQGAGHLFSRHSHYVYRLKEAAVRLSENKRKNQDEKGKNMDLSTQD